MKRAGGESKLCEMFLRLGFCPRDWRCPDAHARQSVQATVAERKRELEALEAFLKRQSEMQDKVKRVEDAVQANYVTANALDLVIVMDCTRSMRRWIAQAKESMLSIVDRVKKSHGGATVRVGFVAYRDFCAGDKRLETHELTEDIASVREFVKKLKIINGADIAEDVAGGLDEALKMPLTAGAKRLILVADAPCHGKEFHILPYNGHASLDRKKYRRQIAASPNIREQVKRMAREGIDITFIQIVPALTAKMATILQEEYEQAASLRNRECEFHIISLAEPRAIVRLPEVVTDSAKRSLSKSKERNVISGAGKALNVSSIHHYGPADDGASPLSTIDEEIAVDMMVQKAPRKTLDWADLDEEPLLPAVRHTYHFRPRSEVNWTKIDLKHSTQETSIKILRSCFASGAMRTAHAMYDANLNKRFVGKVYFGRAAAAVVGSPAGCGLANDVKTQMIAKRLATEFSLQPEVEDGIDFILTSWYELEDPETAGLGASMAAFTAEPYIAGEYKKYNNNNGWTCDHGTASSLATIAQAFSHFTWHCTYGQLMVVDLQGVGCIFTDPQIHSVEKSDFGRGNLSDVGMATFFATHVCNKVCNALALEPFAVNSNASNNTREETSERASKRAKVSDKDKTMTCSCALCGEILTIPRSQFLEAHAVKRELYCGACETKMTDRTTLQCSICQAETGFSAYWYAMKGMKPPTTCKKCKAVAAMTTYKGRSSLA